VCASKHKICSNGVLPVLIGEFCKYFHSLLTAKGDLCHLRGGRKINQATSEITLTVPWFGVIKQKEIMQVTTNDHYEKL